MIDLNFYALAADAVLIVHTGFIGFVVLGLILIVIGLTWKWRWVRNFWFRVSHLAAIGLVVLQSWLGVICPLTIWENQLRVEAGQQGYSGSFVQHWLHKLIFLQAEPWVFAMTYTLFGGAVVFVWWLGPPTRPHRTTKT